MRHARLLPLLLLAAVAGCDRPAASTAKTGTPATPATPAAVELAGLKVGSALPIPFVGPVVGAVAGAAIGSELGKRVGKAAITGAEAFMDALRAPTST